MSGLSVMEEMKEALGRLEGEYPGIGRIQFECSEEFVKKLNKLANKVNYFVPKVFYSDQIGQFQIELEEVYYEFLTHDFRPSKEIDIVTPWLRKSTMPSDEQKALLNPAKEPQRLDLGQISDFVSGFSLGENQGYISRGLLEKRRALVESKRGEGNIEIKPFQNKKDQNRMEKKPMGEKQQIIEKKRSCRNEGPRNQDKKVESIITLGDRMPIEVREMRNKVKGLSSNNFGVQAEANEKNKTALEHKIMEVGLLTNKIAVENCSDMFAELRGFITSSVALSEVLAHKMLDKCEMEFRTIEFYAHFLAKFMRIPKGEFSWSPSLPTERNRNFNPFHRFFVDQLERKFHAQVQQPTGRQLISLCCLIGKLVNKRKLSKRIYHQVSEALLLRVIEEGGKGQTGKKSHQVMEICFQAAIALIQGLGATFQAIWAKADLVSQVHCQEIRQIIEDHQCENIIDLLFLVNKTAHLPTERIRCLLMNMTERKRKQKGAKNTEKRDRQKEAKNTEKRDREKRADNTGLPTATVKVGEVNLKDQFVEAMNFSNVEMGRKVAGRGKDRKTEVFKVVLEVVHAGKRENVEKWLQFVMDSVEDEDGEGFLQAWEDTWRDMMFQQCEYPFMIPALAVLSTHYLGRDRETCLIEVAEDDPDYEDAIFFMHKLEQKVHQCTLGQQRPILPP